ASQADVQRDPGAAGHLPRAGDAARRAGDVDGRGERVPAREGSDAEVAPASRPADPAKAAVRLRRRACAAQAYSSVALSRRTRSRPFSSGSITSTSPDRFRRTGSAAVLVRRPELSSGATKQQTRRSDRSSIVSMTLAAATASAYGPGGHKRDSDASRARRPGSPISRCNPNPPADASSHGTTM